MWRRFVHHACTRSVAMNSSSQNGNNGVALLVTPTSALFRFDQPGNRISLRPSAGFEDLGKIRAVARVALEPSGSSLRFNLAEALRRPTRHVLLAPLALPSLICPERASTCTATPDASEESPVQMLSDHVAVPEVEHLAERKLKHCSLAK
jgi:hypothetical protein